MGKRFRIIALCWLAAGASFGQPGLRAGVARQDITPPIPAWINGYASRHTPATGVLQPISATALAIGDRKSVDIVFITVDLLGLSHEVVEDAGRAIRARHGLARAQVLFNSSHTHSAPVIWPCLDVIYEHSPEDQRTIAAYTHSLTEKLVAVADSAIASMAPAKLYEARGSAGFAINRRNAAHPGGPTDHDVPVLKVTDVQGRLRAVLFGYACHNTTLVDDNFLINGDYAGFAKAKLEQDNPGVTALFLMGCAGDQNPAPRGTAALAEQHGGELAQAVEAVLGGAMKEVHAPVRTAYRSVPLAFEPIDVAACQRDLAGTDVFLQRRAKLMLEAYNKGWRVGELPYAVQAIRFGRDFTVLGLSDEVVVDYSLLFKKRFSGENLYVAGYCNDVQCYIPSKRIQKEGGYEANENLIYYGQPADFARDLQDRITRAADSVMRQAGASPSLR